MPLSYPYGSLRKISPRRYPDLATAVTRVTRNSTLCTHQARLQLEGFVELSEDLVQAIVSDLRATGSRATTSWVREALEEQPSSSTHASSLENLRELALAGATFRRID